MKKLKYEKDFSNNIHNFYCFNVFKCRNGGKIKIWRL